MGDDDSKVGDRLIQPTVGRKVWYWPSEFDKQGPGAMVTAYGQPLDATVVCVWGDRMVNLVVFDANGNQFKKPSTTLLQPDDLRPPHGGFAEWMPYQKGQK